MNIKKLIRIIFRNKTYSFLNIAGLAVGITAATLVFLWVESKINFNRVIPNSKNIYIVGKHSKNNSGEYFSRLDASIPLVEVLTTDFPEIKQVTRYGSAELVIMPENTTYFFEEEGAYADSSLFSMIGVKLIHGSVLNVFKPDQPVVISRSLARKMYGAENPVGRGLHIEGQLYEITGVFENLPYNNTSFRFEWLMPFRILEREVAKNAKINNWGTSWLRAYVELHSNTDLDRLNEKLKVLPSQKAGPTYANTSNFLYPLNRTLLYGEFKNGLETGGGYIRTVRLFFCVGILILLIACINFMNFSTAYSQKRALEVGLRKTFGTKRKYMIRQFLIESGLITCIALLLSIILAWACLPLFNNMINAELSLDLTNPYIMGGLIVIGIFCTFTAGSYPALYLSSFDPISTLKMQRTVKKGSVAKVRQGLVIFQFTMAFILICTTYVLYLQIRLVQNRDIGIEKNNLVIFPVTDELRDSYSTVLNEVNNTGVVESCGFSSFSLLYSGLYASPWHWTGKDPDDDISISVFFITEGLIEAAGIKLIEGADIQPVGNGDGKSGVLVNETLAKRMGEEGHIGGQLGQNVENKSEIIGIIRDFVSDNPYAVESEPAIFFYRPSRANYLFVRIRSGIDQYEAIGRIQSLLSVFTPYHAFEPTLMADTYDEMFKDEKLIEKLAGLFAVLAIFISCLGLVGLSAFSAEQRTKEIGVRKVLGAKITDILMLLGKSYLVLLLISFAIGIPVSLYLTYHYLENYAYRIVLTWDIFIGIAAFIAIVALLTVSSLSLKAAIANPVKSIKTE